MISSELDYNISLQLINQADIKCRNNLVNEWEMKLKDWRYILITIQAFEQLEDVNVKQ